MTKTQAWDAVQNVLADYKIENDELVAKLADILAPKKAHSMHPPVLNENGTIKEAWCKYHQRYENADDMILAENNTKSKGYCKAASWLSNQRRRDMQKYKLEALSLFDTDLDKAKEMRQKALEIEPTINDSQYYDYEADWEAYNAAQSK